MRNNVGLIGMIAALQSGGISFDLGKAGLGKGHPTLSTEPPPLHNRCKCKRVISWNKKYCKACSEEA